MPESFDIYLHDLKPDVQAQYLRTLGIDNPKEANLDVFPIASLPLVDVEQEQVNEVSNSNELVAQYVKRINDEVMPYTDFQKLDESYRTPDRAYAKEFLKKLHQAFKQTYQTYDVIPELCGETVLLPAVIKARESGDICIGLVQIDLASSGEHCDTVFFAEKGVVTLGDAGADIFYKHFLPYDYWYTLNVPGDIHVNLAQMPMDVFDMVYDVEPIVSESSPQKGKRPKPKER